MLQKIENELTHSTLRLVLLIFFLAAFLTAQNTSNVYQSHDRPRALALIGDRYHSPVHIRDGIVPAFLRENVSITFIENDKALTAQALQEFNLLVIFKDGMIWPNGFDQPHVKWMTEDQQKALWDFVHNGGSFLALHNSHGIYPPGGLYYKLFGGDYGGHPAPATFTVRVEDKNHPITQGVEDYEIFDEQHTSKYYLGSKHLLLRNMARDNTGAAAGWWRGLGQGRFVYLSPGHTPEGLGHQMTQRLIRNSIRWLLRLDHRGPNLTPSWPRKK